ncbi:MAG TPA: zf-HC2 domain-containing protein [Gemmatimonadaceae bacterium]|jgi:anti-sigma factor RsiW|nr:zf-HC2 domain-containing protein [Gemmatimonadaceae bacterium]
MTSSNMTCDAFDAALPDYLEGTLDESARAAVEGHLSECVRCASVLRDIDNIRKDAAALPELVPARDLWEGIESRIAAPVIPLTTAPKRERRTSPAWLGIAAAALVISTAGVTYMLTASSLRTSQPTAVAVTTPAQVSDDSSPANAPDNASDASDASSATQRPGTSASQAGVSSASTSRLASAEPPSRQVVAAQLVAADQAHADVVYGREIEMLQKIVSQRKTVLDSTTVAIIERNLKIIDGAIEQSRAALAADPASRLLSQQLTHALDKKVELLRTAAMMPAST